MHQLNSQHSDRNTLIFTIVLVLNTPTNNLNTALSLTWPHEYKSTCKKYTHLIEEVRMASCAT